MQRIGYEHAVASKRLQALQRYQNAPQNFDVILMDISMPVMDGITSAREIRKFEHGRRILPATIIAITGAASASARQEAYSNGIDLFLTKPVSMMQLKRILEDWKPKSIGREN
jgi:CheY-like chemotaxis protein